MAIYLPELADKIKDTIAGLKKNWEAFLAHKAASPAEGNDLHGLLSGGFIIEDFGSNDDGSWVRWSNGLQICWGSKAFPGEGWTESWTGSGDRWYLLGQSLTFPVPFDSAPTFLGTARDSQIAGRSAKLAYFRAGTSGVSDIAFNGWGTSPDSFGLHWLAIGWWK